MAEKVCKLLTIAIFIAGSMTPLIVAELMIFGQFTALYEHSKLLLGVMITLTIFTADVLVIPQIIIALQAGKSGDWQPEIGYLKQEIETLKRNQVAKS